MKSGRYVSNSLRILSWNIGSITSNGTTKLADRDTERLLNSHDIVCLQEVWKQVPVTHFRGYFSLRHNSSSGGVAILIKNNLSPGLSIIKTSNPDILAAKLDHTFFNVKRDIYIINVYARPENSSGDSISTGINTIQDCYDTICNLPENGEILLCGDFNARIGAANGQVMEFENIHVPVSPLYEADIIIPRTSQDIDTNKQGKHFTDLVTDNQLVILNGRTLGDLTGAYTSIQRQGCSVVDYIATSRNLYQSVEHMTVGRLLPTSDHRPLSTLLKCSYEANSIGNMERSYNKAPSRFIITTTGKSLFRNLLEESDPVLKDITNKLADPTDPIPAYTEMVNHLRRLCNIAFKVSNPGARKAHTSQPWHNQNVKEARKILGKATSLTDSFPDQTKIKELYYRIKGRYKKLIRNSKARHKSKLNQDIEEGKILNWQAFQKVKKLKTHSEQFNTVDMENFESFFTNLYSDTHATLSVEEKNIMLQEADKINHHNTNNQDEAALTLNTDISTQEISGCIRSLKCGKAAGDDMLSNDILKTLDDRHVDILTAILNKGFKTGIYPWTNSIITPLHKKGARGDPDNYRAVSVGSAIGKIFSTVMLDRLVQFRESKCPDPINQLGFRKGAQTSDHVLSLMTLAQKYRKTKTPLYATFVDYKKAFDSVPRQALFLKLSKLGICGNFYNVLRNMYSNSTAQIKLSGHLSHPFRIRKGTEQGHPLSPELFKLFLLELSDTLNTKDHKNPPYLGNIPVTHLLWADDLILLSLNTQDAQNQVNKLHNYCQNWGLEVNSSKTKLMIFNNRHNQQVSLKLGQEVIQQVDNYCYLGLNISSTGDFSKAASNDLTIKATRAMYGLRGTIMKDQLSFNSTLSLFNSLVKPIALYGAPIWSPQLPDAKTTTKNIGSNDPNLIRKLSSSKLNRLHLSYLKWAMGVSRKTTNATVYGDTGTRPLSLEALEITIKYLQRIAKLPSKTTLVYQAYLEQKTRDLPWYNSLRPLLERDPIYNQDHVSAHKTITTGTSLSITSKCLPPTHDVKPLISQKFRTDRVLSCLRNTFNISWAATTVNSSKLSFYNTCEKLDQPTLRSYLGLSNFNYRSSIAKLKTSSHPLNIETGRYTNIPRDRRYCPWCKSLNIHEVETEEHALDHCSLYKDSRDNLRKDPEIFILSHHPLTSIFQNLHNYHPRIAGLVACFVHAIITTREKFAKGQKPA